MQPVYSITLHALRPFFLFLRPTKQPVRVRRTAGSPIVFHIPLNDSDPYGLIDYAGSVSSVRGTLSS